MEEVYESSECPRRKPQSMSECCVHVLRMNEANIRRVKFSL